VAAATAAATAAAIAAAVGPACGSAQNNDRGSCREDEYTTKAAIVAAFPAKRKKWARDAHTTRPIKSRVQLVIRWLVSAQMHPKHHHR